MCRPCQSSCAMCNQATRRTFLMLQEWIIAWLTLQNWQSVTLKRRSQSSGNTTAHLLQIRPVINSILHNLWLPSNIIQKKLKSLPQVNQLLPLAWVTLSSLVTTTMTTVRIQEDLLLRLTRWLLFVMRRCNMTSLSLCLSHREGTKRLW